MVLQAVLEQVGRVPTPLTSPVHTVMGSPASAYQSLSQNGPFSVAATSSGAAYQQFLQNDASAMGGGLAQGRVSGTGAVCDCCVFMVLCKCSIDCCGVSTAAAADRAVAAATRPERHQEESRQQQQQC